MPTQKGRWIPVTDSMKNRANKPATDFSTVSAPLHEQEQYGAFPVLAFMRR